MDTTSTTSMITAAAALIGTLGLLVLVVWAIRRFGGVGTVRGDRRLRMLETLALDPKRRVVLIRHDEREHVLLVGGPNDLVISSRIVSPPTFSPIPPSSDKRPRL
jgi:flagellar protein FliO/FliZ